MMTELTVISCSIGSCDTPFDISKLKLTFGSVRFVCITDEIEDFAECGWDPIPLNHSISVLSKFYSNRLASRIPKIFPQFFIPLELSSKYVLWVDSNVRFSPDFLSYILTLIRSNPSFSFSTLPHKKRRFLISEIFHNWIFAKISTRQLLTSLKFNFKFLFSPSPRWNGIILYNICDSSFSIFQSSWFKYIRTIIIRDQLSVLKLLNLYSVPCSYLDASLYRFIDVESHLFYPTHRDDFISRLKYRLATSFFRCIRTK